MSTLPAAIEAIYASIQANNLELDARINELKAALAAAGEKVATLDTKRLAENNRAGRKLLQSYFRRRGVTVEFAKD